MVQSQHEQIKQSIKSPIQSHKTSLQKSWGKTMNKRLSGDNPMFNFYLFIFDFINCIAYNELGLI